MILVLKRLLGRVGDHFNTRCLVASLLFPLRMTSVQCSQRSLIATLNWLQQPLQLELQLRGPNLSRSF